MRRSIGLLLMGIEIGILSAWVLSQQFETGLDALQYHRMANAIVRDGLAPWVLSPLSYIGVYPGSDSSGIPFLAASFSLTSGGPISATVLVYDSVLFVVFGLGLFLLVRKTSGRADLALLAVLMGSLAYGFFTTLAWSLDERSFNVAIAPLFFLLVLPKASKTSHQNPFPKLASLGLISFAMFVSHLSYLLLVPFFTVVPLAFEVVRHQYAARRKRASAFVYFGVIAASPLVLLASLNQLGLLATFGLEYQLESSALFSGNSPLIFLANALVFLGTRVGPVNLALALVGLAYLGTRPRLLSSDIALGGLLLAGFVGLPIVTYSKDLLTPVLVVIGATGVGLLTGRLGRRRTLALAISAATVIAGSFAFVAWNSARTATAAEFRYLAPPGVTLETQDANLWIHAANIDQRCAFGNNPVLLQQVTNEPGIAYCTGLPIDVLINRGAAAVTGSAPLHVVYAGINGVNPSDWFASPDLTHISDDFARLPTLSFAAGEALLVKYNVTYVVVDLEMVDKIPLFNYQGSQTSVFFAQLWESVYPLYRSGTLAVFEVR